MDLSILGLELNHVSKRGHCNHPVGLITQIWVNPSLEYHENCNENKRDKTNPCPHSTGSTVLCCLEVVWQYVTNALFSADAIIDIGSNEMIEIVIEDYGVYRAYNVSFKICARFVASFYHCFVISSLWTSAIYLPMPDNKDLFCCRTILRSIANEVVLWPLLLTWFNFNPSMDK